MKRIEFIAPVESMRGNLSGGQSLDYADNNNPAYEAPNGVQYARNYQPRFIGAKRGADGLKYFTVRTKSATNLKASTRRAMAIVGVTAAIRSALMSAHAADYAKMQQAFEYLKETGRLPEGKNTFKKWFDAQVKEMLVYKRATWSFTYASITFTLHNPYDLASAQALIIKPSIWVKFANFFAFKGAATIKMGFVAIDGNQLFVAVEASDNLTFSLAKDYGTNNPNYAGNLTDIAYDAESLTYKTFPVYTMEGVAITGDSVLTDGEKLTTAEPIEP